MSAAISILALIFGQCACSEFLKCSSEWGDPWSIVLWFLIMLYMFKGLGVICDEYFVPSLEVIVERLQLSNDVAGATFMAAGSSAPELFTSLVATFAIVGEGGVGTIIGSAIFNILVIVGMTGFVACKDQSLEIWWYPLSRDTTFYSIAILELAVVLWDEEVKHYEAAIMFATYCLYCLWMKYNGRILKKLNLKEPGSDVEEVYSEKDKEGFGKADDDALHEGARAESLQGSPKFPRPPQSSPMFLVVPTIETPSQSTKDTDNPENLFDTDEAQDSIADITDSRILSISTAHTITAWEDNGGTEKTGKDGGEEKQEEAEEEEKKGRTYDPMCLFWRLTMPDPDNCWRLFAMSIVFIAFLTYLMVDATTRIGCNVHMPHLIMGLVFLAAGTSIPDALGSIAVAKQGEGDMAVANALGSNVFDILLGLSVPWLVKTLCMGKRVCFVGARAELTQYIGILVFVLFVFIGSLVLNRWKLNRKIGGVLIAFYGVFVAFTLINAQVNPRQAIPEHMLDESGCQRPEFSWYFDNL
eukprot:gnl/TRDRNA2_/TRDRNA2_172799_c0_seq2.p1 gnl/TRDRNA2_/TRDRNA2_172799_c0~~gnl/TRDRNA2_/TRDRNA2_172799_c0_seq2.p1  ORF type:complete len:528 (+),score=92.55 gnl/TRDRNA2_/TRDRNA2_172799_c0_seq2:108-1691(+)